jgi:hypothetical protein
MEKNIFKPNVVFGNGIKSFWAKNLQLLNNKLIEIHPVLKESGVFALSLQPVPDTEYFCFVLPIEKGWLSCNLEKWKNPTLSLDIVVSDKIKLAIELQNSKNESLQKTTHEITPLEDWQNISVPLKTDIDCKTILFSGASIDGLILKEIFIYEK